MGLFTASLLSVISLTSLPVASAASVQDLPTRELPVSTGIRAIAPNVSGRALGPGQMPRRHEMVAFWHFCVRKTDSIRLLRAGMLLF